MHDATPLVGVLKIAAPLRRSHLTRTRKGGYNPPDGGQTPEAARRGPPAGSIPAHLDRSPDVMLQKPSKPYTIV
jgi:hypothetical protein